VVALNSPSVLFSFPWTIPVPWSEVLLHFLLGNSPSYRQIIILDGFPFGYQRSGLSDLKNIALRMGVRQSDSCGGCLYTFLPANKTGDFFCLLVPHLFLGSAFGIHYTLETGGNISVPIVRRSNSGLLELYGQAKCKSSRAK